MEGKKFDGDKVRLDLIPRMPLWALGRVLTYGAKKYEAWNWSKGMAWSRVYGAAMRHLTQWYDGEEGDEETGFSHLWHAFCCIMFLMVYEDRGIGKDDRPWPKPRLDEALAMSDEEWFANGDEGVPLTDFLRREPNTGA